MLVGLGEDRPIVAIVDDVHWADEESLRWLAFLAPRVAGLPTAIVAGLRTGDPGAGRPPLLEIEADPGVVRVEPGTLSIDAATRLIEHSAGGPPEPGFVSACHEASGGNPFLLQELVSQLTAERIAPTDENAGRVSSLRPSTISRSVLLRLARLPDSAAALARSAAVLGPGHDTRELGALAELDPEAAVDAHEALAEAGILTAEPAPGFVHPLIRDAIYSELPGAERSRRHERAARILADSGAAASDVVPHLLEARPIERSLGSGHAARGRQHGPRSRGARPGGAVAAASAGGGGRAGRRPRAAARARARRLRRPGRARPHVARRGGRRDLGSGRADDRGARLRPGPARGRQPSARRAGLPRRVRGARRRPRRRARA